MDKLLSGVSPIQAAKKLSQIVENVTCLECCKFYILPETAECGHTLCHGCWIGRQSCPVCALPLTRRTLKSNAVVKKDSASAQALVTSFEKVFKMKLDEYTQEIPVMIKKDPNINVKAWLADSQNHFSAPVSTQLSTQAESPAVKVGTCQIQVHTSSGKPASPTKKVLAPLPPQDDWDKIESVPDTEDFSKNKENVPINIDKFSFDDEEYTTDHPRRSSRKREFKNDSKPSDSSLNKHSYSNVSVDTEKLNKVKQNWSNVKRMRKEFSKLHKKNKSKLNVSIEMCKKSQSAITKPITAAVENSVSQQVITIEDCTPNINDANLKTFPSSDKVIIDENLKYDNENDKIPNIASTKDVHNDEPASVSENIEKESVFVNKKNDLPKVNHLKTVSNHEHFTKSIEVQTEKTLSKGNIPFLKKGALLKDQTADVPQYENVATVNQVINENTQSPDSDDIQITIKVGNTLTNIFIKKKKNDVRVKLNTDQEAQTSQCMEELAPNDIPALAPQENNVQNIEINIGSEGIISTVTQEINGTVGNLNNNKPNLDKTVSTKKNTASAETVPFEITESVEKELSKIMECDDKISNDANSHKSVKNTQIEQQDNHNKLPNTEASDKHVNVEAMEFDDVDIFASGSVKETNVQLLKATKPAPSEVLMPTLKHNKKQTQTQRQADKRDRETNNDEIPRNKKLKVTAEINDNKLTEEIQTDQNKDVDNQSCSMNYDLVMGQVFASIDADIETIEKSQSIIKYDEPKTIVEQHMPAISQQSQNLKTQLSQKKVLAPSKLANASQNIMNPLRQKDSENLFTLSMKETQIDHHQKHGPETQAHIENLLTPGMCRDLASTNNVETQMEQEDERIEATPCQEKDDSDMSMYEDTPQKSSFTKKPSKSIGSGVSSDHQQKINTKPKSPIEKPQESQAMGSIINISDADNNNTENATVIESKPKQQQAMETPSTINQFCNQIKHNSTPVARKSLNFESNDKTLNMSTSILIKNTQEQEIIARAFEATPKSFVKPPAVERLCIAASCLTGAEVRVVEKLCALRKWVFVREYTNELTHLVVGVDDEGRSQRTVKFMCAVAAGKWIVKYEWVEQCMKQRGKAAEWSYEALDWTGDPGPMRARIATRKLFEGITFYCKPPFTVLNETVLKTMLEGAGGTVVGEARAVCVSGPAVKLLLAEPEHTQENQFTYLALELNIVPVNYEWALNCLGSYSLSSIMDLLLCPVSLLPPATQQWPAVIVTVEDPDSVSE